VSERRRGPQLLRELGAHPEGGTVGLYQGRYGPYVSHDGVIASVPRNSDPAIFSLEQALPLLVAQREKGKGRRRKTNKSALTKAASRKAAQTASTRDRAVAGKPKKTGAAKKTAVTRSAKKPRSRPSTPPG
jgi:DNA topoisomerase-1